MARANGVRAAPGSMMDKFIKFLSTEKFASIIIPETISGSRSSKTQSMPEVFELSGDSDSETEPELLLGHNPNEIGQGTGENVGNNHAAVPEKSKDVEFTGQRPNQNGDGRESQVGAIGEDDDEGIGIPTSSSSKSSEFEDDDESDVITLYDSDDDEGRTRRGKMYCFRCGNSNRRKAIFKDWSQFQFHIKRHTLTESFSCPTCQRPFLSMNHCLSHEIRAHGAELDPNCYDQHDPVISAAKRFMAEAKDAGDVCKMVEDNYETRIVTSTPIFTYRGPPVNHILECYEIHLNHSLPKASDHDLISKIAIRTHKENVKRSLDQCKLGKFTRWKVKLPLKRPYSPPTKSRCTRSSTKPVAMRSKKDENKPAVATPITNTLNEIRNRAIQNWEKPIKRCKLKGAKERRALSKAMKLNFKLRSAGPITPSLVPNSSFTDKEKFLGMFGLCNKVRLHLHLKKPLRELRLPKCSVAMRKMNLIASKV